MSIPRAWPKSTGNSTRGRETERLNVKVPGRTTDVEGWGAGGWPPFAFGGKCGKVFAKRLLTPFVGFDLMPVPFDWENACTL
jgi:hypothetical protein